jgi:uncharacterized membrane protein YidH (DUF202 family)
MEYIIWYTWSLILIILWLLINRHIIGGVWYNFFSPIITGYALYMLSPWYDWTWLIVFSTVWWRIITKTIMNYINFSLYPRYVIYTIMSILLFVTSGITYTHVYDLTQLSLESSQHLMLLFLIILAMGIKVYAWWRPIISRLRWWYIARFFALSSMIYIRISQGYIQTYFSTHISNVIILGIITLFVCSYRWLQIKEMIRFRRLIRAKIISKKKR